MIEENMPIWAAKADKAQKLKDDLISHFMNEDIDEKALQRFFRSIVNNLN